MAPSSRGQLTISGPYNGPEPQGPRTPGHASPRRGLRRGRASPAAVSASAARTAVSGRSDNLPMSFSKLATGGSDLISSHDLTRMRPIRLESLRDWSPPLLFSLIWASPKFGSVVCPCH
jgi:hypothetical protein